MKDELMYLFIFLGICCILYLLFRNLKFKEGMTTTDASGNTQNTGIAGNAAAYGAKIKAETIKLQDILLISKYRSDYETVILNLDDLINNLMLKTALSVDKDKPEEAVTKLSQMGQAKSALNSVMKFVDATN
jgi:hypothetical protein